MKIKLLSIIFLYTILSLSFSHAQIFNDATGLPTGVEYNFSTQFAEPDGGKPVVMLAEVTPDDELNFFSTADNGSTWNSLSTLPQPGNSYGGNMIAVGSDLIAGGCTFGQANNLYKSTDNGVSWTNTLTTGIDRCLHLDIIELDSGDLLTFFGTYSNTADTIYKSTDGGSTWNLFFTFPNNYSYKVGVLQLDNGDLIYSQAGPIAPFGTLRRSTDNGASWNQQATTAVRSYNTSLIQANNGDVIASFAIGSGGSQVRRSTDSGITWTAVGAPGGAVNYYGTDLLLLENNNILLDLVSTTTNDRTYVSKDNGSTRNQITTRPIPVSATNYESDMFQLSNGEVLISNPHWGQRPVILKHVKPPIPTIDNPINGYNGCSLIGIKGTASNDANEIYYEIVDSSSNIVLSGTGAITLGVFSIPFATPFDTHGSYTINVYENDMIALSDPATATITIQGDSATEYTITPNLATNIDENWVSISYSSFLTGHTFTSAPIILATPQSQNNGDNYPVPRIRNVTSTGFEISICLDRGDTTCNPNPNPENIGLFIVDQDAVACIDDIDAGITTIDTDGTDTAFTFSTTFTNEPYVFTTPQTSSQGNNIAGTAWVDDNTLTVNGGDFVGCVHQYGNAGNVNICTPGQPDEQLGWLAIDPTLFTMPGWQDGTEGISNSTWTNVGFSPAYSGVQPVVMVTQNSDNGGQDPQYARAKNVTEDDADIRYCEADAENVCNTHTNELVRWFSLSVYTYCGDGLTQTPNSNAETEQCDDGNNINGDGCDSMCQNEISGDICIYTPSSYTFSGSYETSNIDQILEIQFTDYMSVEDLMGDDAGYYTTIQISDFTGATYNDTIANSQLERYATGVTLLSGDANTNVVLDTGRGSYRDADMTYTFIKRDTGTNTGRIGYYGVLPWFRLTIPAYTRPDNYSANMVYTLYEN